MYSMVVPRKQVTTVSRVCVVLCVETSEKKNLEMNCMQTRDEHLN